MIVTLKNLEDYVGAFNLQNISAMFLLIPAFLRKYCFDCSTDKNNLKSASTCSGKFVKLFAAAVFHQRYLVKKIIFWQHPLAGNYNLG